MTSFADARRAAEAQGFLGTGEFFKIKEGDNRVRLTDGCLPHQGTYNGQRNFKWLCYVIDRKDGKVKAFFMPHTVFKAIEALQTNPDYAFTDMPMPYDITIHAKKAGTKEVEYSLIPARKETPLTQAELEDMDQQKSLNELQAKLKESEKEKAAAAAAGTPLSPTVPLDADDIQF